MLVFWATLSAGSMGWAERRSKCGWWGRCREVRNNWRITVGWVLGRLIRSLQDYEQELIKHHDHIQTRTTRVV